jgi:hypothetical protein
MKLSKKELLKKFPQLSTYADPEWIEKQSLSNNTNFKAIPFLATLDMIESLMDFCEDTKFSSAWEKNFSIRVRLKQIKELIEYFSQNSDVENTLLGVNLHKAPIEQKQKL